MKRVFRGAGIALALMSTAVPVAFAQQTNIVNTQQAGSLKSNQTAGYGAGKVLTFTYTQNFDCVDQPKDDLDFNKKNAAIDPGEMQTPICQAGIDTTINPPGQKGKATTTTDPLYVLIPMFSVDNDQNPKDAISC
ncbi:MAG TPA: hypothetical protein VGK90_08530, partial [Rhizomicrobium sp.]